MAARRPRGAGTWGCNSPLLQTHGKDTCLEPPPLEVTWTSEAFVPPSGKALQCLGSWPEGPGEARQRWSALREGAREKADWAKPRLKETNTPRCELEGLGQETGLSSLLFH